MFVTLVFQGKTGAVRLPGDRQLGVGSPSQPRRGPREPSSADTSPRRLRAPPARPASHGLPPAGPGVCSFGRPLPHLSSMRMRCPPEPTKCRDWKHKQEIEEGPPQARAEQASSLPVGPRPGGAVCVLCPRGEGQQGAGHVPPRTADLPGALVTACASICPPRGQASCIIQAPWRGPRERALTRADWPDRVSRQRTLDEQGVCPFAPSVLRAQAGQGAAWAASSPGTGSAWPRDTAGERRAPGGGGRRPQAGPAPRRRVALVRSLQARSSSLSFLVRDVDAAAPAARGWRVTAERGLPQGAPPAMAPGGRQAWGLLEAGTLKP